MLLRRSSLVLVLALVPAFAALGARAHGANHVWKVAAFPQGGELSSIQQAIDAASDGDVILVKAYPSSGYGHFDLAGKSLSIQKDGVGKVVIGTISPFPLTSYLSRVRALGAAQHVVLRGLDFDGLIVEDVQGSLWIEDCRLNGQFIAHPGLRAKNVARLELVRCALKGFDSIFDCPGGGMGVTSSSSAACVLEQTNAYASACTFAGGRGLDGGGCSLQASIYSATDGADALVVNSGMLWASGCAMSAGDGGAGIQWTLCSAGGDGGDGLELGSGAPTVWLQSCALFGGSAGAAPSIQSACGPGQIGNGYVQSSGTLIGVPGITRAFAAASPAREGQAVAWLASGAPGELCVAAVSASNAHFVVPALLGVALVEAPTFVVLGALPASGSLSSSVPVGELGAPIQGARVWLQGVFVHPQGFAVLGSGSVVVLLDAAL